MFRSIMVCAFLLFGFLPSSLARDAPPVSRLDSIIAAGVLKVGSAGDYKPFTFKVPATGSFSGFDIDQAKSLADALGVKLEVVPTSWPKLM
jgi:cyclohexadienyl dehydratase